MRAILFDAVGTLIYPDPPVAEVYFEVGRSFGSKLSRKVVGQRLRTTFRAEEQADIPPAQPTQANRFSRKPTNEAREQQRWQRIVESVFADVSNSDGRLFTALWEHFADSGNWSVFADVPETLLRLKQLDFVIGIASNFDRRLLKIIARLSPLTACEHVFCSSLIGFPKPSPRFFRAAEKALNLSPGEILLVGDDWENDYEGATAAGWQAVYVDRSSTFDHAASVKSLLEIVELAHTSRSNQRQ